MCPEHPTGPDVMIVEARCIECNAVGTTYRRRYPKNDGKEQVADLPAEECADCIREHGLRCHLTGSS